MGALSSSARSFLLSGSRCNVADGSSCSCTEDETCVCLEDHREKKKMKFYLQRNRPPYHPKLAASLRMLINLVVFSKLNDAHFMSIR